MKKKTTNDFILSSKIKHADKYDYSLVDYTGNINKVKIICPEHGIFEQIARDHCKGQGCPKCAINIRKKELSLTKTEFINRSIITHKNKYDYSLVNYTSLKDNIKIICPIHSVFEQRPDVHYKGEGCKKCFFDTKLVNDRLTKEEFADRVYNIHKDKYNYSLVNYINHKTKVKIICPIHGEFEQRPDVHFRGGNCPKCNCNTKTTEKFINDGKITHNNKYDYINADYLTAFTKVKITCPTHGVFEQTPNNHLSKKQGCPKCAIKYNKSENEVKDFIKSLNVNIIENDKNILNGKELDIYIPSHNIAIEYDGLYWHNECHIDNDYHLNKTQLCEKQGIQLIHIFEDEWLFKQDIVKSRLMNILGLTSNKIYARKCLIKEVPSKECKEFLLNNHIQGSVNSSVRLGLYLDDELVSLMTFGKPRIALGSKSTENTYELVRFCNKLNTSVVGGADKLLKHFIKTYNPKQIISYADRRWSQGGLYDKLGFIFIHNSKPNYYYINGLKRQYRFGFRKSILVKQGYDLNKTAKQIMLDRGIYRIYDCGTKRYELIFI